VRADDAVPLARHYLENPSTVLRYKAIIVLGWMGDPDDVPLLGARFPHECVPQLRGYLATALRQILLRLPAIPHEALNYLLGALDIEQDDDALSLMIVSAQTISGASFGLKESVHEATVTGDVQRARVRAVTFLSNSQSERNAVTQRFLSPSIMVPATGFFYKSVALNGNRPRSRRPEGRPTSARGRENGASTSAWAPPFSWHPILDTRYCYANQPKTGPVSLTQENMRVIEKDGGLVKQAWAVQYILEQGRQSHIDAD